MHIHSHTILYLTVSETQRRSGLLPCAVRHYATPSAGETFAESGRMRWQYAFQHVIVSNNVRADSERSARDFRGKTFVMYS